MSNEPGGPAPLPDPYSTPGGHEAERGPVPPPPSGYEAVLPYSSPAPPTAGAAGPAPAADPFALPSAGSASPYGTPASYGAQPPYGTPSPYGPPSPYGTPSATAPSYGSPPTGAPYGQAPAYGNASPYGQAPTYGPPSAYGQSPYGPTPYGYPGAPFQTSETEPFAIAALVTSLAGFVVGISYPVGLGLGIAALRRIRKNGKQGRGMAIAGVVVGAIGSAFVLLFVAFFIAGFAGVFATSSGGTSYSSGTDQGTDQDTDPGSDQGGELPDDDTLPSYTLRTDLRLGDCLESSSYSPDLNDTGVVDCSVGHAGEVVAISYQTEPTNRDLSVDDPVWNAAWDACVRDAEALLPADYADHGELWLYTPHPDDFDTLGAHTGYCTFFSETELLTGSAVAHTLTFAAGSAT